MRPTGLASPQDVIPGTLATPMWHDPAATSNGMSGPDTAFFRYSFPISGLPGSAVVAVNVDDDYRSYVNGTLAFENRDGGYAQIVDHVDVSSLLREGLNTFAIMAVDGALAGPYDRRDHRDSFHPVLALHRKTQSRKSSLSGAQKA